MKEISDQSGLYQYDLDCIKEVLQKYPEVEKAILFGSRAKGNHKHGSDVDIAISGPDVSMQMGWEIAHILNEDYPLPYFFDVLDYTHLKDQALREHIDRVGVVIYKSVTV